MTDMDAKNEKPTEENRWLLAANRAAAVLANPGDPGLKGKAEIRMIPISDVPEIAALPPFRGEPAILTLFQGDRKALTGPVGVKSLLSGIMPPDGKTLPPDASVQRRLAGWLDWIRVSCTENFRIAGAVSRAEPSQESERPSEETPEPHSAPKSI